MFTRIVAQYTIINRIWKQTACYCIQKQRYSNIQIGQSISESKYSGHILDIFSQKKMELPDEDLKANSGSEECLPDKSVNEGEANIERPLENRLEDGFGILFKENQISKESSKEACASKKKSKKAKIRVEKGNNDDSEDGQSKSKKKKKHAKRIAETPDHFIALQISNPTIHESFADVQEKIVSQNPPLIDAMVSIRKLHVTVMPLCLPTQDRIDKAMSALDLCASRLFTDYKDRLVVLGVTGIGNFRNNVLFAKVTPSDPSQHNVLQHISDVANDAFAEHGIKNTDKKSDFKPHVTIAKLSKNFRKLRQKGIKKIDPSLYKDDVDRHFGHQVITTVQLCSMFKADKATGYYKILHEASFGPQEISNLTIEDQCSVTSAADILVQWTVKSAKDKCLATSRSIGDETNKSIESEENKCLQMEHLTGHCVDEQGTVHKEKLDLDQFIQDNTAETGIDKDSDVDKIDSKEEVVIISAANSEVETELDCSSDVKVRLDVDTMESFQDNNEGSDSL